MAPPPPPCAPTAALLGVPGTGVHARRFAGVALWDVVATLVVAALTAAATGVPLWRAVVAWFVTAQAAHWAFRVPTAVSVATGFVPACTAPAAP